MVRSFGVNMRVMLLASAAMLPAAPALAQTAEDEASLSDNQEIVVTGQTTRDRPLITASADITYANRDDIDRKATALYRRYA